jgi:hypothetical protein
MFALLKGLYYLSPQNHPTRSEHCRKKAPIDEHPTPVYQHDLSDLRWLQSEQRSPLQVLSRAERIRLENGLITIPNLDLTSGR